MIRTVSPGRHRPVMALTRAMAAKQAGQSSADVAASPDRFPRRYRYPSSSSSSSSSSTSNFSPPRTPTDLVSKDSSSCSSCISLSSHVQRLIDTIDTRFKEIYVQFEHVSNRLSSVEESISDQHSIINELERDLSIIADKLNKISSKNSDSVRSPSGTDKPQKSTQTNFNCSCSSSSLNKSQCISNYQSHPSPSTHATYTSFAHVPTPPPRTAVHWRSAPSSRSIIRLPSSSPRHIGPTDPNPSSPLQSRPLPTTSSRSFPPSPDPVRSSPPQSCPLRTPPTRSSPQHNTRAAASKRPSVNSRTTTTSNRHSILILGDSNTKHIKLSGAYNIVRAPTFLIQDIGPALCKGFGRVWIHCGINNLKYNRCTSYSGVKEIFKLFMSKLGAIRNICPDTKIYVSPILPCAIPGLNDRAGWFNSLLFSVKHIWWNELKINGFCCSKTGMLVQQFRSFRNRGDKIHLGMHGIRALECALLSELNKVNGRLYSSVVYNH